jgi:hypothetical protein
MLSRRSPSFSQATLRFLSVKSLAPYDTKDFPYLRSRGNQFVDKTGAIADLLSGIMRDNTCAFFTRPRKFGKSLTLSIAAEMLAAGPLPKDVKAWPGYKAVDIPALFGGLQVHERLLRGDATLGGLLQRPHFVVKLSLGGATSGAELKAAIFDEIAGIAETAFGESVMKNVRLQGTTMGALGALVNSVPSAVPVALLVDEYDAAIIQDVNDGDWASAKAGIKALRSLVMSTKSLRFGSRIERCLITGVARFAHTPLFSGANNFLDLTNDPLLTRVLGFSEAEIRATFPAELERLAQGQGMDVNEAMLELAEWYNGFCFHGSSSCFNPFLVLTALKHGRITQREMEASSGSNWLGLTPGDLVLSLVDELQQGREVGRATSFDIADLEKRRVRAVPLLLQTGLLSLVHPQLKAQPRLCRPPNKYARSSLSRMLLSAMDADSGGLHLAMGGLHAALTLRSPGALSEAVKALLLLLPSAMFKDAVTTKGEVREARFHASLACALLVSAQVGVRVDLESGSAGGRADIIVRFGETAWVLEVGVGGNSDAKLAQAQVYGEAQTEKSVLCCAVVVTTKGSASTLGASGVPPVQVTCTWSERTVAPGAAGGWAWTKLVQHATS